MRAFRIQVQWEQAARILLFLMSHCLSANRCTLLKSAVSSIPIAKSNRLPKFENVSKAVLKNYRMNSNLILLIKEDGKSILLLYDNQDSRNACVSGVFSCPKAGFSLVFSLMRSAQPVETVEKGGGRKLPSPPAVLVLFYADNSSVRVV